MSEIKDGTSVYENIKQAIIRSDEAIQRKMNETSDVIYSKIDGVKSLVDQNSQHIIHSDYNIDRLEKYIDLTKQNVEMRLTDKENEVISLKKSAADDKSFLISKIDHDFNDVQIQLNRTSDIMNDAQVKLSQRIGTNEANFSSHVVAYLSQVSSYNQKLKSLEESIVNENTKLLNKMTNNFKDVRHGIDESKRNIKFARDELLMRIGTNEQNFSSHLTNYSDQVTDHNKHIKVLELSLADLDTQLDNMRSVFIYTVSGMGGIFLLLFIVIAVILVKKNNSKPPKSSSNGTVFDTTSF